MRSSTQNDSYKRICAVMKGKFAASFGRKIQKSVRLQGPLSLTLTGGSASWTMYIVTNGDTFY